MLSLKLKAWVLTPFLRDLSMHGPVTAAWTHVCMLCFWKKVNCFCLLLWILSCKQEHTNIPGAATRLQLNDRKHENSEKLEHPPVGSQWTLGFQQTLNTGKSACELQVRSFAGRAGPQTPSVILHMFPGLSGTRTGSLKSPSSMGSVTRTISSFWPYVLSSPIKGLIQKHLLKGGSK